MALTEYQCSILRLLAGERKSRGERYVADGAALNALLSASRLSRDLDLFHDTDEAIAVSWEMDKQTLLAIARRQRYSKAEVATLGFSENAPDAALLGVQWHQVLEEAEKIVTTLPAGELGTCVLDNAGSFCTAPATELQDRVSNGSILLQRSTTVTLYITGCLAPPHCPSCPG